MIWGSGFKVGSAMASFRASWENVGGKLGAAQRDQEGQVEPALAAWRLLDRKYPLGWSVNELVWGLTE